MNRNRHGKGKDDHFRSVTKTILKFHPIEFEVLRRAKGVEIDPIGIATKMNHQITLMKADYIRVEFEAVERRSHETKL